VQKLLVKLYWEAQTELTKSILLEAQEKIDRARRIMCD
jgi:hypothetical protein